MGKIEDVNKETSNPGATTSDAKSEDKSLEGLTAEQLESLGNKVEAEIQAEVAKTQDSSSEDAKSEESGKTHSDAVPYARFKEVNDTVKQLRAELDEIKTAQRSAAPKTWDSLSIEELKSVRTFYREKGDTDSVDFVNDKIAERLAQNVTSKQTQLQEFNKVRTESWMSTVQEFPELKSKDSEHYRRTEELVESDPRFDREPDGHAIAARLVASEMLRERVNKARSEAAALKQKTNQTTKKTSLETGGRAGNSTSTLDDMLAEAEASNNAYSPEWKRYFKALDTAKRQKG